MKIYLDIFFLVNAGMDFVVLMAVSLLWKRRTGLRRMVGAALLGAVFAAGILVGRLHTYRLLFFVIYVGGQFLTVTAAFGKMRFRQILFLTASYFCVSAVLAAGLMQIRSFCGAFSVGGILVFAVLFLAAVHLLLPVLWKKKEISGRTLMLDLIKDDIVVETTGFVDTGNLLREPFGGEGVAVASAHILTSFICSGELIKRPVPFHSVGKDAGFLEAFRLDRIIVHQKQKKDLVIDHPWIAISTHPLSGGGEYEVILHPDMVAEGACQGRSEGF